MQTPAPVRPLWPPLWFVLNLHSGLGTGFVSVTLGYVLSRHGFSVAAIAGLISLNLMPTTWRLVMGPILDLTLTPRRWFLICSVLVAACGAGFALVPLQPSAWPILALLSVGVGAGANAAGAALLPIMSMTTGGKQRGIVAGLAQAGNLSGTGLGGGAGLWIAVHAGGVGVAAMSLAIVSLLAASPLLFVALPDRPAPAALGAKLSGLWQGVWSFARTRVGVLAMIAVTIPVALNASGGLMPAVSRDWKASADLVAAVTGALSGLITLPGCLAGGYLCTRLHPRRVYMASATACAVGQIAMALSSHTPYTFGLFVLLNGLLQGIGWGSFTAVIFENLGAEAAATLGTLLGSLGNIPLVTMTYVVGQVQTAHGSSAMLMTEALTALVCVAGYSLLAWFWRPAQAAPTTMQAQAA